MKSKTIFKFTLMGAFIATCGILMTKQANAVSFKPLKETQGISGLVLVADDADKSNQTKAEKFIDSMGQKAIGFLSNESLSQDQKEKEFRKLLRDHFDMPTIGRFVLGKNWKTATPSQQKEYQKLFESTIVEIYAARFNDYKGEAFEVDGERQTDKKDSIVTTYIVPDTGSKVQVDWRVRDRNGSMKIIDVIIEGVSMSVTQRSDFSSVIQRGGGDIEVLLEHLRK